MSETTPAAFSSFKTGPPSPWLFCVWVGRKGKGPRVTRLADQPARMKHDGKHTKTRPHFAGSERSPVIEINIRRPRPAALGPRPWLTGAQQNPPMANDTDDGSAGSNTNIGRGSSGRRAAWGWDGWYMHSFSIPFTFNVYMCDCRFMCLYVLYP